MTDLPLTKIAETTKNITFRWTPVLCIGYVFYVNGKRVSNTWNPSLDHITFSKVPGAIYRIEAIQPVARGEYPSVVILPSYEAYGADPYSSAVYSH